jgi:hypothetical protein
MDAHQGCRGEAKKFTSPSKVLAVTIHTRMVMFAHKAAFVNTLLYGVS